MPSRDPAPLFTRVDWAEAAGRSRSVRSRTAGFAAASLTVLALFAYDYVVSPDALVAGWDLTRMDWLFVLAAVVAVRYAVVPLLADHRRTAAYAREFLDRPAGALGLAFLVGFGVLGVVGPEWFGLATSDFSRKLQPPVFASVHTADIYPYECVGRTVGERCYGTWQYPLGTTSVGEDVAKLLVYAMHLSLKLAVAAGVLMVVVATAVGATAGYFGGRVDAALMWYVDVQRTIPAIVVYIVVAPLYLGRGLFALALVFGLFDWGGIARLVRSETLERREAGYVRAARSAGASDLRVLRRHVIPNTASTIVTALTRQLPVLILLQVALSYLKLHEVNRRSLGEILLRSLTDEAVPWHLKWWVWGSVIAFLAATVVAFNLVGDAASDVLDPREEGA